MHTVVPVAVMMITAIAAAATHTTAIAAKHANTTRRYITILCEKKTI